MTPRTRKSLCSLEIDQAVGHQIRNRRQAAEMTQAALGEAIGVTFQQVQKYETGSNRLSVAMIVKIAAALHCPVSDLLGAAIPEGAGRHAQGATIGVVRHLSDMYQELSPGSRALVATLVRTLHEQETGRSSPGDDSQVPQAAAGSE